MRIRVHVSNVRLRLPIHPDSCALSGGVYQKNRSVDMGSFLNMWSKDGRRAGSRRYSHFFPVG